MLSSSRNAREQEIAEAADEFLVLDGVLLRRIDEPVLIIDYNWTRGPKDGCDWALLRQDWRCTVRNEDPGDLSWSSHRFRLDQADRIDDLAHVDSKIYLPPIIDVAIPEAVRFPADECELISSGISLCAHMRDKTPDASVTFFQAYAALRDAISAIGLAKPTRKNESSRIPAGGLREDFDAAGFARTLADSVAAARATPGRYESYWQSAGEAIARFESESARRDIEDTSRSEFGFG